MTLRAWAELLRVSALFTVPGDALAGAAASGVRPNRGTALAVGASLCLYEAGMALNDWADREEDAIERPHRPIPSGRITPNAALAAASGLTAAGLLLASRAGRPALALSTALAASVWAYDLRLKHTPAGPAAMGAARALDVLLGATATRSAAGGSVRAGGFDPAVSALAPPEAVPSAGSGHAPSPAGARGPVSATRSTAPPVAGPKPRIPAPPVRRGVFARLSAWAGGRTGRSDRQSRAGTPVESLASTPAGPVRPSTHQPHEAAPRTAARAGGPTEPLASTPAARPAWVGDPMLSTPQGVFAWLSAWAGGSAGDTGTGRTPKRSAGGGWTPMAGPPGAFPAPSAPPGVLARLFAWPDGPTSRPATDLEALAGKAADSPGRSLLARLSAWADGSAAPRSAAAGSRWSSVVTGPVGDPALSTHRTPLTSGGLLAWLLAWADGSTDGSARQGRTVGGRLPAVPRGALAPAALLGAHTLAVTTVSRREVYGGSVGAPLAALVLTGVLGGVVGRPRTTGATGLVAGGLAAAYVVTAGQPYLHAALNPSPQLTQRAVGGGIRAMIPFQAALAARGGSPGIGLAVMGLVPLARKFAKRVSVT